MAVDEVEQDRTHFSCIPLLFLFFFFFGRGSGKAGLKNHNPASLFSEEETEALKWGVTMLGEAGSQEKVKKKKRIEWAQPVWLSV